MNEEQMENQEEGHMDSFLSKLQQASSEINTLKDSFSKGMVDLDRIQTMLKVEGVDRFSTMMEKFERRIHDSERMREEATVGAQKYSEELEKEKERLMKLWDAYKTQEEELATTERKTLSMEERLQEIEESKTQLERDLTTRIDTLTQKLQENEAQVQELDIHREKVNEFERQQSQMDNNIQTLQSEIQTKDETINNLQQEVESLREYEKLADIKVKYDEVTQEYEKEKERLTKLFKLYEEADHECKKLREELNGWQEWYDSNSQIFDSFNKLLQSAGTLRRDLSHNEPPVDTPEKEFKKKRRMRLKK